MTVPRRTYTHRELRAHPERIDAVANRLLDQLRERGADAPTCRRILFGFGQRLNARGMGGHPVDPEAMLEEALERYARGEIDTPGESLALSLIQQEGLRADLTMEELVWLSQEAARSGADSGG